MAQKLTTEQFIQRAKEVHGDKYDYSKVEYKNARTKICIICPEHGEFLQTPNNHLLYNCPQCAGNQKLTAEQFVEKARKIHGAKYDYSKIEYKNNKTKICIICPEHGEFLQVPIEHYGGRGCPQCSDVRLTTKQFVEKARKIHGDKYDYSKSEYINSIIKIKIICPEHGEFLQTASIHFKGCGCPQCSDMRLTTEQFVEKARKIHGDKYDYSKVEYINIKTKICIICPEHGEFLQTPNGHLQNHGCPRCGGSMPLTIEDFTQRSNALYNDKYNYDRVHYINNKTKVVIVCPKHGEFDIHPLHHLDKNQGCPRCAYIITKGHQQIVDYIKSICSNDVKINDRQAIKPLELDVYLPEINLAFEYHGLFWHSFEINHIPSEEEIYKHQEKYLRCREKNITLVQILENEWLEEQEETKRRIKCYINNIDFDDREEVDLRYPLLEMDDHKISKPQCHQIKLGNFTRNFWDAGIIKG